METYWLPFAMYNPSQAYCFVISRSVRTLFVLNISLGMENLIKPINRKNINFP